MASTMILCDTNILIELSKNNVEIIKTLKQVGSENIAVSSVSAGEFIHGALDKAELRKILKAINSIQLIHVDQKVSEKALELLSSYSLSHKLSVPDALIAATSITHEIPLYTLNLKDFKYVNGLELYRS